MSAGFTEDGLIELGALIEESRLALKDDEGKPLSYRALSDYIKKVTGVGVHKDTLNRMARGVLPSPSAESFVALAAAKFLKSPSGEFYTVLQLCEIATGVRTHRSKAPKPNGTARTRKDDNQQIAPNSNVA